MISKQNVRKEESSQSLMTNWLSLHVAVDSDDDVDDDDDDDDEKMEKCLICLSPLDPTKKEETTELKCKESFHRDMFVV